MSRLTRIEQETIINFNVAEAKATVFTRDKAVMRKLDSLVTEFPDIYKCIAENPLDKTYSTPKQYVKYCRPRKLSEERRKQIRSQMAQLNCKRKS